MEHSQPSPVHPSTTKDALQLLGDMYEEMDPVSPSLPTLESSQPFAEDSMGSSSRSLSSESMKRRQTDPVEQMEPSKRFKPSELINQGQHGSTHSSPPIMEPSQRSSVDSMSFPPPVETSQRLPADSIGFSPSLEPTQLSPVDSVLPSSPNDASQTIREMYQEIDPAEQIDPLIRFLENRLHKMNNPSEAGSSSSEGWVETVRDSTKLAAKTVDMISIEAGRHSTTNDAVEAAASIMSKVLKGIEEMYWVWIGLSVAAFTVESLVDCTDNKYTELLLKIIGLAKDVKHYSQQTGHERETLRNAAVTIVEGAIICCDCLKSENSFWSATTAAAQLQKTNKQLRYVKDSLALAPLHRLWDKDVFLSNSGRAHKNFVRQLHQDLSREHVSCFFDEDCVTSFPLGENFVRLIFKAAESCKIAVVLLSKEFILSKWSMIELSAFVRAKQSGQNVNLLIFPIFYKIYPKELYHFTRDGSDWQKLNVSNDTIGEWQAALRLIRSTNGLVLGEDGDEVNLRKTVVKRICHFLKEIKPLKLLDFEPVGIKDQVEMVKAKLDLEGPQPALAVIVCGFRGVGKTTLASSVVQSLDWYSDFKFCWVKIDEKTQNKTSHIIKLQKQIIKNLEGYKPDLRNTDEGRVRIKKALEKKFSLLFIDNVVDKEYVKNLLPKDLPSSKPDTKLRIILTSPEKSVKAELQIKCEEYEVKGLSDEASKSLLLKTILQTSVVKDEDEEDMINKIAAACRGVPLWLTVFGNHLRVEREKGNYKESYLEALAILREPHWNKDIGIKTGYSDVTDSLALSSLQRHWDKDVFLSHSGAQKNFVRDLQRDLTREHVSCFFDEDRNSLPLGEKFPRLIFKAAESCKIAVVVVSKKFILSKWPMIELAAFIRAKKSGKNANLKILPIFYKISTEELKALTKDTPPGWQELEVSNDTRAEWLDALDEVRPFNGLNYSGKGENQPVFRDSVVKEICCLLKEINPLSHLNQSDRNL